MNTSTSAHVLTGRSGRSAGIPVQLCAYRPGDGPSSSDLGPALRAPLLTVREVDSTRLILVGRVEVELVRDAEPSVHVVVEQAWRVDHDPRGSMLTACSPTTHGADEDVLMNAALDALRFGAAHRDPRDPEARLVVLAKGIAEMSRDAVEHLRLFRYSAEHGFGLRLQEAGSMNLPPLIELGIAASRARDRARAGVREGLDLWKLRNDVYHAHRRRLDPTLPERVPPVPDEVLQTSWYATFDAGVRQCTAMAAELEVEIAGLQRLLAAASTYSSALDVKAQEHFNFVAAIGAVVLGLPALVLAAYGAAAPDFAHRGWIWPLVGCVGFTLLFAGLLPGSRTWRDRWIRMAWALGASLCAASATWGAVHFRA